MYSDQVGCESHDGDGHYCYWEDNLCHDEDGEAPDCINDCVGYEAVVEACIDDSDQVNCFDVYCAWLDNNLDAGSNGESCWDDCDDSYNPELDGSIDYCASGNGGDDGGDGNGDDGGGTTESIEFGECVEDCSGYETWYLSVSDPTQTCTDIVSAMQTGCLNDCVDMNITIALALCTSCLSYNNCSEVFGG